MHLLLRLTVGALLGATLFRFDNVKAKWRFDNAAYFAGLQSKCRILKFFDHLTASEEAEVAALILVARVSRVLFGKLVEVATCFDLLLHFFSFRACLFVVKFRMRFDVLVNFLVRRFDAASDLLRVVCCERP